MAQELHFTSSPRGIKPGAQGFCKVAATAGMPNALIEQLERLSVYRAAFPAGDPRYRLNPPVLSHRLLTIGGRNCHVLSRIGIAPPDYTGRTNFYAHHLVLGDNELLPEGPAWLLRAQGLMSSAWQGEPRIIPSPRVLPPTLSAPEAVITWQSLTGDANWGLALADACQDAVRRTMFLIFTPDQDLPALIDESLHYLPPDRRWLVEFTSYATDGGDVAFYCSGLLAGTPQAVEMAKRHPGSILDLTKPLGSAPARKARTPASAVRHSPGVASISLSLPPEPAPPPALKVAPAIPARSQLASRMSAAVPSSPPPWLIWIAAGALLIAAGSILWLLQVSKELDKLRAEQRQIENRLDKKMTLAESELKQSLSDLGKQSSGGVSAFRAEHEQTIKTLRDDLNQIKLELYKQKPEASKSAPQLPQESLKTEENNDGKPEGTDERDGGKRESPISL